MGLLVVSFGSSYLFRLLILARWLGHDDDAPRHLQSLRICRLANLQSVLHRRLIPFLMILLLEGQPIIECKYLLEYFLLRFLFVHSCWKRVKLNLILTIHASCAPRSLIARFHNLVISLKVVSLDMKDEKTCFSCSIVIRPIAFGMIFAVFSFVTIVTDRMGICN